MNDIRIMDVDKLMGVVVIMLNLRKVYCADLTVGMHVSALDRPWLESPFLVQGFYLENFEDIEEVSKFCEYVYVDEKIARGSVLKKTLADLPFGKSVAGKLFPNKKIKIYTDSVTWKEEFPSAKEAVDTLSGCLKELMARNEKGGPLEIAKIKKAVEPMIDSVTRNPDACIWLARMKQEDNYIYEHSLGASIWAVALGRQLGLPKQDLRTLALGGLLFDVGKLKIDTALMNANRRLTAEEFQYVKSHVQLSVDSLKEGGLINQDVIDMVAHHHERHNGGGYPQGLAGTEIPVFARIAAIVDCYDAITSHRIYAAALPPSLAIKKLYEWKDIDFQAELIEEFIQAIGIYPAGTLVELSSGEIAIVVAEYRTRRLRPQVMIMLDKNKQPLEDIRFIDMLAVPFTEDGQPLDIVNSLEPGAYGIDMTSIEL
ncbi:MAG: HD-GYP domain-containing protein [Spongiibacteraceae bacterium]